MQDQDLIFLKDCSNEQLKSLIDIVVYDKDGKPRYTESLSDTQQFCENYPNNIKALIPQIVNEIQLYGGNSIVNKLRGHGVPYREVLEDVCKRLKVNFNKKLATPLLETELLRKVAVTAVEKMSEEDIKKFDNDLDKSKLMNAVLSDKGSALMTIVAVIVAQFSRQAAIKGGIMLFGRLIAPRFLLLAVPAINVIAALWAVVDIASPAYRVTIPFTIMTAFIRRQLTTQCDIDNLFE